MKTVSPAAASAQAAVQPDPGVQDQNAPYMEACAREGLNASECVGRLIWFKATAGNERFHTYTFQQRVGVLVDWFRVLRSDQRDDRFWAWGIINDPACCKPGEPDCPAKSTDETYGFDWCPGDDVLLKYVGKPGYVDPACGLKDAALDPDDPHSQGGKVDQRHSACDLRFGTSTGALGIRKFPNPRFDLARWQAVNGGKLDWSGFSRRMDASTGIESDSRVSKLADASVEPPFLIGTSCGSCHIAFDPLNPPADPARPKWENIKGLVGNQYTRMSELLGSGMSKSALEYQMFAHARPGVTDTSAISHDQVNNPGTINALVNVAQRPVFKGESIAKWRKVADCGTEKDEGKCWCEPGRSGKCWAFSTRSDDTTPVNLGGQKVVLPGVHHILKGGEDSTGALEAIQRVYFNIGSCAEQCWVNHFTDMRQVDPQQRGFGQTPFNVGQCRRDCPSFRAVEDRLQNILDFFASAESDQTDLAAARANTRRSAAYGRAELVADLEKEFGKGAVARGSKVFGETCARCHSSIPEAAGGPFASRDFAAPNEAHPRKVRADFLGNDEATPVSEVGTFPCRALHSNHMAGHLYMEYGSESMRARPPLADLPQSERIRTRSYQVTSGDTLSRIAQNHGVSVQQLKLANNLRGTNLRRGQSLVIPNGGTASQVTRSKPQQLASRSGSKIQYQVRSGDNLWSISQAHGVTHADLAKWNGLSAKSALKPGMKLVVWPKQGKGSNKSMVYQVRRGDSLSSIAARFQVAVNDVMRWNQLGKSDYLKPGQELTLFVKNNS